MSDLAQGIGMTGGGAGRMFADLADAKRALAYEHDDLRLAINHWGAFGPTGAMVLRHSEERLARVLALGTEDGA